MGKAKNLRNRLLSYTRVTRAQSKTFAMVHEATQLHFHVLKSELEALLVEAELVRTHQPQYNIMLKDDKSHLYVVFTKEDFPRVLTARKQQVTKQKHLYSQVFGPFPSGYKVKQVLKLARPIFKWCNEVKKQGKPCFYAHIHVCSGACAGKISKEDYNNMMDRLKLFMRGKTQDLIHQLKEEMNIASERMLYEYAGQLRDLIRAIQDVTSTKKVLGPELDIPQLSVALHEERIVRLKRVLMDLGVIPKEYELKRIEGYDISNTQGSQPVCSMVVFTHGVADKSEYKSFNIRLGETPNDVGSLSEALIRRQNHLEWGIPHLVVIDGGKGQLRAVQKIWKWNVPVVSLAKEPDRLIVFDPHTEKFVITPLKDRELASQLLRQIRDESHRFAKRRHVIRRTKSVLK